MIDRQNILDHLLLAIFFMTIFLCFCQVNNIINLYLKYQYLIIIGSSWSMADNILDLLNTKIQDARKLDQKFADLDLCEVPIVRFTTEINPLLQQFQHLEVLYLVNCAIESLETLPRCRLTGLDLSYNNINDNSKLENLLIYPSLQSLLLSHNKITNKESIVQLSKLKKLSELDYRENPVQKNTSNEIIFGSFQYLDILNGTDKYGNLLLLDSDQFQDGQFDDDVDSVQDDQIIFDDNDNDCLSEDNQGSDDKKSKSQKNKKTHL